MTEKQKYVGAFLEGYFSDRKFPDYNFSYFKALEEAEKKAKKKWKQNKNYDNK